MLIKIYNNKIHIQTNLSILGYCVNIHTLNMYVNIFILN